MSVDITNSFQWINNDFILENVRKIEPDAKTIEIKAFKCQNALPQGENFGSFMIRILVDYVCDDRSGEEKHVQFIIKTTMTAEVERTLREETAIDEAEAVDIMSMLFNKEIDVYAVILPQLQELLKLSTDNVQMAPRCYSFSKQTPYLILQDLSTEGYKNVNKRYGLDVKHLKIVLTRLAAWHGTSAYLYAKNSNVYDKFSKTFFEKDKPYMQDYIQNMLNTFSQLTTQWPGFENISKKILSIKNGGDRVCDEYHSNTSDFYVLTHSDFWCNNIMFSYDSEAQPLDAILVDFAMVNKGSPGRDITHLLFSSSNFNVIEADWDELIKHYHTELSKVLKAINYPKNIPSLAVIREQVLKSGLYSALVGVLITGLRYTNASEFNEHLIALYMNNSEENQSKRQKMFADPECVERIKYLFQYYERNNFF